MRKSALASLWQAWRPISGLPALLLAAGCLTACSGTPTTPLQAEKVSAPEQCLAAPSPLPPLADPSLEGVYRHLILVANEWWALKGKHECLAEFDRLR